MFPIRNDAHAWALSGSLRCASNESSVRMVGNGVPECEGNLFSTIRQEKQLNCKGNLQDRTVDSSCLLLTTYCLPTLFQRFCCLFYPFNSFLNDFHGGGKGESEIAFLTKLNAWHNCCMEFLKKKLCQGR